MTSSKSLSALRVDLVGSLLRPAQLKEAFAKRSSGEASEEDLQAHSRWIDPGSDRQARGTSSSAGGRW